LFLTGETIEEGGILNSSKQTRLLARESCLKVTASGGVSSLEDLERLKYLAPFGMDSVIVGKLSTNAALLSRRQVGRYSESFEKPVAVLEARQRTVGLRSMKLKTKASPWEY